MWKAYWNLMADPFLGSQRAFVATSGHEEAVARLVETVESGGRLAILRAKEGLGKTTVLARIVEAIKGPGRRVARVSAPADGPELLAGLAEALGVRVTPGASRGIAWRALSDAVKLCRWQKIHAILMIDDAHGLVDPSDRLDLDRLVQLDPNPSTRLTVIQAVRDQYDSPSPESQWQLAIRLWPLTCSETNVYVSTKLAAAGRYDGPFTPRAISRLHDLSWGNPRGVDRLATLALIAGAVQELDRISAEVVEGVAQECDGPWPGLFATPRSV